MTKLSDCLFKTVHIVDTDGNVYDGYVDTYTSALDNDGTEESIGILPDKNAKSGIELYASEIQSIEIVKG